METVFSIEDWASDEEDLFSYCDKDLKKEQQTKEIVPDNLEWSSHCVTKEWEQLKGLVTEIGLDPRRHLTRSTELCKDSFVARVTCYIDMETFLEAKVVKMDRDKAMLSAVRDLEGQLRRRYYPELKKPNEEIIMYRMVLKKLCSLTKRPCPRYNNCIVEGRYYSKVTIGSLMALEDSGHAFLDEAEGVAAKAWLFLHGGNWEEVVTEKPCNDVFDGVEKPCDVFGEVDKPCSDICGEVDKPCIEIYGEEVHLEELSPSHSVSQDIERRNEIKDGLTLLDALMRKEVIKSSVKTTCSYPKRHQTLDKDLMRLSPRKVKKKLNGERKSWLKKVLFDGR